MQSSETSFFFLSIRNTNCCFARCCTAIRVGAWVITGDCTHTIQLHFNMCIPAPCKAWCKVRKSRPSAAISMSRPPNSYLQAEPDFPLFWFAGHDVAQQDLAHVVHAPWVLTRREPESVPTRLSVLALMLPLQWITLTLRKYALLPCGHLKFLGHRLLHKMTNPRQF